MARKPPRLTVKLSLRTINALNQIWLINAEKYGVERADSYIKFLRDTINRLSSEYPMGKPVTTLPEFQYIVIKRRQQGHGHIAVYKVADNEVNVATVYHTVQDWQNKLARGEW